MKAKRPLPKPIPRKPKPLPEPVPEPKKRQHTKPMPRTRKPILEPILETIPEPVLFPQLIQPRKKPVPRTRKANATKANANKTIRKPFNLLASVEPWRPRKTQKQKHAFFKANATEANAREANANATEALKATKTKGQANAWVHPLLKQSLKARKAARTVSLG
jgi:hypothetical protein